MTLALQPSAYPLLVNARTYVPGVLDTRLGIVAVNGNLLGATVHSLKRLNDPLPGANSSYAIIVGAGTALFIGTIGSLPTIFTQADANYSGNPLGLVAYRPPNSPESWLYLSDSLQMRKVRTDGLIFPQGIAPPLNAPTVDFAQPLLTVLDDFNAAAVGSWTNGGTAGAITANAGSRLTDTVFAPFNQGPGWVEYIRTPVAPLTSGYGVGMRLLLNAGLVDAETVVVSTIYPASQNTTILSILYDVGPAGMCTIVPASPSTLVNQLALRGLLSKLSRTWVDPFTAGGNLQIQPNATIQLSGGLTENIQVLSSTPGPLGTFSFRAKTANPHNAGESLTAPSSFRTYDLLNHADPVAVTAGYFRSTITTGVGTISNTALTANLSIIGTRPTQPSDEFHLSVRLDVPGNLTELRVMFDVDSATNDFAHNFYYWAARQNDLTPAATGTSTNLTALTTSITNTQVDQFRNLYPGGYYRQVLNTQTPVAKVALTPGSGQTGTGNSQWTELFFKVSDLIRVGTDTSRTLANVAAVRIQLTVTGSTVCDVHGLYLKGSYGPDVGVVGNDYYYRYRRRSSLTGAKSNPGPYQRSGLRPHGQRVAVTVPGDATEGDQLDVFRWGGAVVQAANGVVPWLYVGSVPNPGPGNTATFNDDFADSDILNAEVLEFDNQQPYATVDVPRTGTCNVIGTSVKRVSGDLFNTQWAPGSLIDINGVSYTLYNQPSSNSFLEIVECASSLGAGATTNVTLRPSVFDNPDPNFGGAAFCNPTFAYDNNVTTAALGECSGNVSAITPGTNSSCRFRTFPAAPGVVVSGFLYVLSGARDNTILQSCSAEVDYSLNGGATWTPLWSASSPANHGSGTPVLDSVGIPAAQDLTQIMVRVNGTNPTGNTGNLLVGVNEIYVVATYASSATVPAPFVLRGPTLLAQPMYAQWGPFNGYVLSCGDPYQPGVLHCCKPGQPDCASDQLDVEVSTPSEPLLNGCMFGSGTSFCWTDQRMIQLYPSTDLNLQLTTAAISPAIPFVPVDVPGAPGLLAPWGFCVGDRVYYESDRGILATSGSTPVSITDPYLSLLFQHDSQPGVAVTVGSATFYPPDFTKLRRLFWERNHVKYTYTDLTGVNRVIVYNVLSGIWSVDDYRVINPNGSITDPAIGCCYAEEASSLNRSLLGGVNVVYQETGALETGNLMGWQARAPQVTGDYGYLTARDGYVGIEASVPVNLVVNVDGVDYTHVIAATPGAAYARPYVPLQGLKGKVWEWALTSAGQTRIWLKDCAMRQKRWADQQYQPFQPWRNLTRELEP